MSNEHLLGRADADAHRLLQTMRFVAACGLAVVGLVIGSRGYPNWYLMSLAAVVVGADAGRRIVRPTPKRFFSTALDVTALGASCLIVGMASLTAAVPVAYAAVGVMIEGGLKRRRLTMLFYGGAWSVALALASSYSLYQPRTPGGFVLNAVAQGAFLLVVGIALIVHGRLTRLIGRYRREAEEATERKAEFLRNISHEIRTPMNGILGMADLLVESELGEENLEQVSIIRSSGFELLSLINDLLDLSWLEAGEIEIEQVPFAIRDALSSLLETFAPLAADKSIELDMHVGSSVPDVIVGDPGRFRQVMAALVSNAVKFTDEGAVWVRVGAVQGESPGTTLRISVADTGSGMSEKQKDTIFSLFSQTDGTLTREKGGTGIGLSIATRLTHLMGGSLRVESELSFGSTFYLTLPVSESTSPRGAPAEPTGWEDKQVLMVCEPGSKSDRFHAALVAAGFGVTEACSAPTEGDVSGVDAIIFDVDADLAAVEEMRRTMTDTAPVLVITSSGQRGDSTRARDLTVAAYLTRPLSSDDLVAAVKRITADDFDPASSALITVHKLREARQQIRVLVADDSPTNRAIASLALRRRGYVITEVADGSQALSKFQQDDYDVILMDIQMPVMDGLEATARIREVEVTLGTRIPIIALTAHALREDRDKARAAGVDAYLTKPLRIDSLVGAIEEHLATAHAPPEPVDEGPPAFDRDALYVQLGSDWDTVTEVVRLFRESLPERLEEIEHGFEVEDVGSVQRPAHTLKGELGVLCAPGPHIAASELDAAAKAGDWARMRDARHALEIQLKELEAAFDDLGG